MVNKALREGWLEPHIYKAGGAMTAIYLCVSAILGAFSILFLVILIGPDHFGIPVETSLTPIGFLWLLVAPAFPALAVYMAITALTRRIILHPDSIEEKTALPFGHRRMARDTIAGKQVMHGIVDVYLLFPKDPEQKIFSVSLGRSRDRYFIDWMAVIPDRPPPSRAQ